MRHKPYYGYRERIGPEISRYLRQGAAYSNEGFDLTSMLANVLTDQDRGRGLSVPKVGYTAKNFERATKLIRRMRRLNTLANRSR